MTTIRSKRWIVLLGVCVLLGPIALVAVRAALKSDLPTIRDALPENATEVQEHYVDLFPDYSYCLKAKIREEQVEAFAKELNMAREYTPDPPWGPSLGGGCPEWWTVSPEIDDVWVFRQRNIWSTVKWEDGYVYLYEYKH